MFDFRCDDFLSLSFFNKQKEKSIKDNTRYYIKERNASNDKRTVRIKCYLEEH